MSFLQAITSGVAEGHLGVYASAANEARFVDGTATAGAGEIVFGLVGAPAPAALLARELELPAGGHLLRLDRVDFPPGGEAFLHTHQGPGIRVLLAGSITITTQGTVHTYLPGDPWFETGPDPVHAATHPDEPSAFVRCMVLPAALAGKPSIRYVRDEDRDRPKTQRYTVFLDEPVTL